MTQFQPSPTPHPPPIHPRNTGFPSSLLNLGWRPAYPTMLVMPCGSRFTLVMIPRILHQTFGTRRPLAIPLERCIEANVGLNPAWEYRYYDNGAAEEVVEAQLGPTFLDLYRRIDPSYGAAKADVFRYACIHAFGGCYLDIKSVCTRSLTDCIRPDDECLLSYWNAELYPRWGVHAQLSGYGGKELQQWFLLASPGHPFIEAALFAAKENLEKYSLWRDGIGQRAVLRTTGPIAFTKAIYPLLAQHTFRMVDSWADLGLLYESFDSLASRTKAIGATYRDAVRPLLIPSPIGRDLTPAYFGATDAIAKLLRRGLAVVRRRS